MKTGVVVFCTSLPGLALAALSLSLGAEGTLDRFPLPLGAGSRGGAATAELGPSPVMLGSTDSPPPSNPFTDMPVNHLVLNDFGLTPLGEQDQWTRTVGLPDGRVVIFEKEGRLLRARRSIDGGGTFPVVLTVGGSDEGLGVLEVSVDSTGTGTIYAAWVTEDPQGATGVMFATSSDMGATWSAPRHLVWNGNPSHGVTSVRVSAGPGGAVAIAYWGEGSQHPYALVSGDAGGTWNGPLRIDPGAPASATTDLSLDVEIASDSAVHVAYAQNRGTGLRIYHTRSGDGGTTWTPETDLSAITPSREFASRVDLETAPDGSVLASFWDSEGSDHLYVLRSAGGGPFTTTANWTLSGSDTAVIGPRIEVSKTTATAMVFYTEADDGYGDSAGPLRVTQSANNGASFAAPITLANDSCAGFFPWSNTCDAEPVDSSWVACWSDCRANDSSGTNADVFCRNSVDQGVSWGAETRVDDGALGADASSLGGVTTNGTGSVLVGWAGGSDSGSRSFNLFVDRSAANPLAFGVDASADLIDQDLGTTSPNTFWFSNSATDGVSGVYAAFVATDPGPHSDIYVRSSLDGGHTFGPPVLASGVPAGTRINSYPVVAATPDGKVYLAYESQDPSLSGGAKQLRFNVSSDFGGTWGSSDTLLADLVEYANGHYGFYYSPATQVRAVNGGTAFVSYSDGDDVFLARTSDGGASFDFNKDVDQDSRDYNYLPRLCVNGSNVILTFVSPNVGFNVYSVWGTNSIDGGTTFAVPLQLRPESAPNGVNLSDLACDTTSAVAVWEDLRSGSWQFYARRFDGASWNPEVLIPTPPGVGQLDFPSARYADANTVVVASTWAAKGEIWVSRSTDGGASFPTYQRLDDAAPVPDAQGSDPILSSDKAGNVWVSWLDRSAGFPELVVRASQDAGANFGPVRRLRTKRPQGTARATRFSIANPATLPGAAFFSWNVFEDHLFGDALLAVHDVNDLDRDLVPAVSDCNDESAGVSSVPVEVTSLTLAPLGFQQVRLDWNSQDATAGPDTVYDIATGSVFNLLGTGDFGVASCLAGDVLGPPFDQWSDLPAPGDALWSLVRARNSCGTGSFGDSTLVPDPRDDLDLNLACP